MFTAIVHRKTIESSVESSVESSTKGSAECLVEGSIEDSVEKSIDGSVESSVEIDNPVLEQFRLNPELTLHALAKTLDISLRATEKKVANLQEKNKLKHIGPKKGGYWQVL